MDAILSVLLWIVIVIGILFVLIPIGNENSTVRRLPYITFGILIINTVVFFVTLPATSEQSEEIGHARDAITKELDDYPELKNDPDIRKDLRETGLISASDADDLDRQIQNNPEYAREYELWLSGPDAIELKKELEQKIGNLRSITDDALWYRFGLAPNGEWKFYQLITSAFIHANLTHLLFNMIFFFAVAFSLEDVWGRSTFLVFYLLGAAVASLPQIVSPVAVPSIGASGAISATMGAFLVRLYKTKIKIFWVCPLLLMPSLALRVLAIGRRPYGVVNIQAYIYLPFYFISQILYWWWSHKMGETPTVGYSVHVAGFTFGILFAGIMRLTRVEERHIQPQIEAKVSFGGPREVTESLEMLDKGEVALAEKKLKVRLGRNPDDLDAVFALIQVYQHTMNFPQLNVMYGKVIHHHLSNGDTEAALYAYDGLLSGFPDNHVEVTIPPRDWIAICEYLHQAGMDKEAAVEYERLVLAWPNDPLAIRACIEGGESALLANDNNRAVTLFGKARDMGPGSVYASRVEVGLDKCRVRLENRPAWETLPAAKPGATQNPGKSH